MAKPSKEQRKPSAKPKKASKKEPATPAPTAPIPPQPDPAPPPQPPVLTIPEPEPLTTDKPKPPIPPGVRSKIFAPKSREELEMHLLYECSKDPRRFVRHFFGLTPSRQQDMILAAAAPYGAHVTVRSGRGIGKSAALAWLVIWFILFHKDCKAACTAPSAPQLRDVLWAEISKWHQKLPGKFKKEIVILSDRIVHASDPNLRFAVARTARKDKPEALQGIRATNTLYIVDEASGVDEEVFVVAEGSMTLPGSRVVLCGNPTRSDGYFYNSHAKKGVCESWTKLAFSSIDSPFVDRKWVDSMKAKYGTQHPFWKIHVLGEFPDVSADILIPFEYLERARTNTGVKPDGERVAGLDVARFGDDRSCLVIRHGQVITHIQVWNGYSIVETAQQALNVCGLYDTICIDEIGVGGGAVDVLRQTGKVRVVPVNVSMSSTDPQFSRLRDQLWFAARDWFCGSEPVSIARNAQRDNLIAELADTRFGYYQGTGRVKVESKDDMKKRLHYSPDIADALTMTFAIPHSARGGAMGLCHTARAMGAVFSSRAGLKSSAPSPLPEKSAAPSIEFDMTPPPF